MKNKLTWYHVHKVELDNGRIASFEVELKGSMKAASSEKIVSGP